MKRIWSYLFSFALLVLSVVPTIVQADTPAVCLIGDHPGIPESDAQTAALLVCDALRQAGHIGHRSRLRGTCLSKYLSRRFAPSG